MNGRCRAWRATLATTTLRRGALLLAFAAAGSWPGASAVASAGAGGRAGEADEGPVPAHVMSLSMCTDELLLQLLPPQRIASVTYYARKTMNLRLWPQAARVAVNSGTAEEVFAAAPDLVLTGTYTTPATRRVLERWHIPLLEVPPADSFEQIRTVTRRVAQALHRQAVAETLLTAMDATLRQLAASKPLDPIRVAAWGEGGSIPGRGTLFDAILQAAGGINIVASDSKAAYTSFDIEQLLAARPDVIAYPSGIADSPGRNTDVALHPLILKLFAGRRIVYPSALFSCGMPASAEAAVELRANLLAAMRAGA